ncbi:O-methyltransferase [Aureitalea marina]|uniref:Methyltransferase n=1 Tax=Aureitalea marina TaxID=930804 RepID=A0A2S7KMN2_9FLAO|nr:class I SAM-dependent methyltransferase [Aureitalea marina]PQB03862.1 hypothetical protein BST85_02285 [Aureitalea marina]
MLKIALAYLRFLTKSLHLHGIHSPFVYEFQQRCVKDRNRYPEYKILEQHRMALLNRRDAIEVTDLGAGSRVFRSDVRSVRSVARNAGIGSHRQQLLFRLCRYFNIGSALELGTSLGMGSLAIKLACPEVHLVTVEGCPNTAHVAEAEWLHTGVDGIDLRRQSFEEFFETLEEERFDLIYIDGDHSYAGTMAAFDRFEANCTENGMMIFDDIYWSQEMTRAWEEIRQNPRISVSIDSFGWGIAFFRREQEKQHFYLRV